MVDPELVTVHTVILQAKSCEEVFGPLGGDAAMQLATAKRLYRKFASVVHEDRYVGDTQALALAHETFSILSAFWRTAQAKIEKGTYGTKDIPKVSAVIASQTHKYQIDETIGAGDLANVFGGVDETGTRVIVKMARHATVNDLLVNEARVTADLVQGVSGHPPNYQRLFPRLLESFRVKDHLRVVRQVNVFEDSRYAGVYTLNEIVASFPRGVDPKHFVWIFKRLLMVLSYAHGRNWIHGAVLPTHVLVRPADHSVLLVDWSYACERGHRVMALSRGYKTTYYPSEVLTKGQAGAVTDIYMAAKCMEFILGGEHAENVPAPFMALLDGCLLPNPYRRIAETLKVYDLLDQAAKTVYGPSKFIDLVLT